MFMQTAVAPAAAFRRDAPMRFGWEHLSQNDRDRIADAVLRGRIPPGPFFLEIHPTNRCNSDCVFCFARGHRAGQTLPWDRLETVLREGADGDLRLVRLSGGGEPLIYPQIDPLLDLCGRLGLRIVDLTTNAIVLERFAQRIVQIGTDFVFVSLNECDPDRFAATMQIPAKNFDRAIEGIRALCRARDDAPPDRRPTVAVQFCFWRDNYMHLKQMVAFGIALNADQIVIKTLNDLPPDRRIPPEAFPAICESILEVIEADARPDRCRLRFDFSQEGDLNSFAVAEQNKRLPAGVRIGPAFAHHDPRREYCYMPWFGAVIAATGVVYSCCMLYERSGKELGDIHAQSLGQIWRGRPLAKLRRAFRNLMLLRGRMQPGGRLSRCIDSICLQRHACLYNYDLCDEDFYAAMARRMEAEFSPLSRLLPRTRDALIGFARRLRGK